MDPVLRYTVNCVGYAFELPLEKIEVSGSNAEGSALDGSFLYHDWYAFHLAAR